MPGQDVYFISMKLRPVPVRVGHNACCCSPLLARCSDFSDTENDVAHNRGPLSAKSRYQRSRLVRDSRIQEQCD